jgi:glycosyltransferase involved in cell wall biosynthesis
MLLQHLPLDGARALMVSSEGLGNMVALRTWGLPVFCLCLTPLRVAYDPHARERYFNTRPSLTTRAAVAAYMAIDRLAWQRYQRVFCISREIADRVTRARLVEENRIEVVHPGVDVHYFKPDGPRQPFFLLPGRIMWTKNVELGIDAFVELKRRYAGTKGFRLVVAGMVDEKSRSYLEFLRERAGGDCDIEFVVSPSDATLRDLYQRCYGVLFTAFNEDWGLVPLEAMSSGRPVIAVARGGPLESIGDGETGFLCAPDPDAFATAMARLIDDPLLGAAMGEAGRRRVACFPWARFVGRIDDYVDALVAPRNGKS